MPYRLTHEGLFLDIGSGVGQLVMLAAAKVGCRSHGLEVVESRHNVAVQFMK